MAELVLHGTAAAPGLAVGPLVVLDPAPPRATAPGGATDLDTALATARDELAAMAAGLDEEAEAVLAFQIELLGDPELVGPARAAIAAGTPPAAAWRGRLDALIDEYRCAEDAYFRARAADLVDLRDRVQALIEGRGHGAVELPPGAIVTAVDLPPSRFLTLDWARLGGVALAEGSPSAHVAMLARGRGVPFVTGLGTVPTGRVGVLDADRGMLIVDAGRETLRTYEARSAAGAARARRAAELVAKEARLPSGERIEVALNVDRPDDVADELLRAADGVGLFRTEFLFIGRPELPDETVQLETYRSLLRRLEGKPCVLRTLDIGGDKPLPGIDQPAESNPFLGLRGIRLCLERPALFRPQLRAILRAAVEGDLLVMLPMVSVAAEIEAARALFLEELRALERAMIPARLPPLGIMVEVPAAALAIERLDAAFYSIGSNDLIQYVMAASREAGGRVAALADPLHPAVLRLIGEVVAHGRATGRPVSLCGEMAAEERALPALLELGLRRLSVAPAALGRVKLAIAELGDRPS